MAATMVKTYLQVRKNIYHVLIRWHDGNNQPHETSRTTRLRADKPNKKKAEAIRMQIQREYEEKLALNDNGMLVSDWFLKWYHETERNRRDSTNATYKRMIENCIVPYFREKKIKLCDLKTYHIQDFYSYKEEGGASANTVIRYHAIVHQSLKYAVNMDYLNSNPSDKVNKPKPEKHTAKIFAEPELKTLLTMVKGTNIETPVYLAAWFGMRRGEIIGLRWSSIDFDKGLLSVNGVISDKSSKGTKTRNVYFVPRTKTESSMRTLSMPSTAVSYLKKLKAEQDKRRKKWPGYNHEWDDFVCVRENGDLIPPEYVTRNFPKFCEKCGLGRLKLHELRHTNASFLLDKGANMKEIQAWLGHSTYDLTANTYAHIQQKNKDNLADKLDGLMDGIAVC